MTFTDPEHRNNVNERHAGEINASHISDGADQHSTRGTLEAVFYLLLNCQRA